MHHQQLRCADAQAACMQYVHTTLVPFHHCEKSKPIQGIIEVTFYQNSFYITDVVFSLPNSILASCFLLKFILSFMTDEFLWIQLEMGKGFFFLTQQCIYSGLKRAGLLFFKWKLDQDYHQGYLLSVQSSFESRDLHA